jgi:phosphatidylinositol 4-kinase
VSRQSTLISHNGILTLSKIATNLYHIIGTQEGVLQIYHQKLCSPPSSLDQLIIEQFGNILISTSVSYKSAFKILTIFDTEIKTQESKKFQDFLQTHCFY